MNLKQFLKPTWKKIIVFVLLYLSIPYPLMLLELGSGDRLSTIFFPLTSPFILIDAIESFEYGLDIYTDLYFGILHLSFPFVWLLAVYFLSCWIISHVKLRYILLGILGLVAVLIILIILFSVIFPPSGGASNARACADMVQLQEKAELIKEREQSYINLSCLYDDETEVICTDIEQQIGMEPTIFKNKNQYCAFIKLTKSFKGYYCIDSTGHRGYTNIYPSVISYCDGKTFICPSGE